MKRLVLVSVTLLLTLTAVSQAQVSTQYTSEKNKKVTICHSTDSATNPYVKIKIAKAALKAHLRHRGDIIPAPAGGCPITPMSPTQGGIALSASLTGAAEVPGPGDTDGQGQATIRLTAGEGRLCYQITASSITLPASAAHIHVGAAGTAGDIVVGLTPPDATGNTSGCVPAARTLVTAILANPAAYYVNVHTTDLPNGAIRGQLT